MNLKRPTDPVDFVVNQIPIIFNKNNKTNIKEFKNSLREIEQAFDKQIKKFKDKVFENFKITNDIDSYKEINDRALFIIDKTGDFELNSICLRLSKLDNSNEKNIIFIERICKKANIENL